MDDSNFQRASSSPALPLWRPSESARANATLTRFVDFASRRTGGKFPDYAALHRWSVDQPGEFWSLVWEFCDVRGDLKGPALLDGGGMLDARWFPEARLNYAENLLRRRNDGIALVFWGEDKVRRSVSWAELHRQVAAVAAQLRAWGVGQGDRVAGYLPNMPEAAIAMLATASLGAVWSSCSPDFGARGVLERFGQIEPKVLFACDGYWFNGERIDTMARVREVVQGLPSLLRTVIVPYAGSTEPVESIPRASTYERLLADIATRELSFARVPFDHPLFILYSSGTTGVPKCIVHGVGGTLLQHLKEHRLHTDVRPGDRLFYATTCGWMMWNWLMSGLASEATLVLYDGSPLAGGGRILFDLADEEGIAHFGTSAKFIDTIAKLGLSPARTHRLRELRSILSTGSPLAPESFDYVYKEIKQDVCLSSISGGTDIISCFVLGCPTLPVWRGESQCIGLGLSVKVFDDAGREVVGEKGELVCTRPFPSMPVCFWNDADGSKYRNAYFARFLGVWCHGDYVELTEHDGVHGMIIYGRSDATLKPGGVRIGTAEIYRQVEQLPEVSESLVIGQEWQNDTRIVLFVKLREGVTLDRALVHRIREHIRRNTSPAHVPAKVVQVHDIPRTKSGKIVELAVREVVHGRPVKNLEALANPEALDQFRDRPELREDNDQDSVADRVVAGVPMYVPEWTERGVFGDALPLDFLPSPDFVRTGLELAAADVADQSAELAVMENLAAQYVREALTALGVPRCALDEPVDAVANRLGIAPQHRRLFARLLQVQKARFGPDAGAGSALAQASAAEQASRAQRLHPQLRREIVFLSRCGAALADVLRGRCDPLSLLFPEGAADEMAALYRESVTFGPVNVLVAKAVETLAQSLPPHRSLRILELGAGTGGTTAHVLSHLDQRRTEYFVTDVGAYFLRYAQESFARHAFVRYAVIDVEKSPEAQGWQNGRFDLVIAANVLHATRDLEQTLRNVRRLLKPDGTLVLLEGSERRLWLDITFGLTGGWWRFSDTGLRREYALLAPEQWLAPLRAAGFPTAAFVKPRGDMVMAQAVIVARAGADTGVTQAPARNFLVLADRHGLAEQLAESLRARGHRCDVAVRERGIRDDVARKRLRQEPGPDGVVCLFGSHVDLEADVAADTLMETARTACTEVLDVLHEVVETGMARAPRLWLVTEDCAPLSRSMTGIALAPVRGLALAVAQEHPDLRCAYVDLERQPGSETLNALCDELIADSPEDRIAFRKGVRSVQRLVPWRHGFGVAEPRLKSNATYVITGGLGPLGLFFAEWLVSHGARHLALVGRSAPHERAVETLRRLRASGATVHVWQADVARADDVRKLFERLAAEAPPVAGVIHAAGVLDDGILRDQRWDRFAPVLAPKVAGAWNLHRATRRLPLDFFILFSSTAAVLGHAGQANHAAANAFLDSLAHARRAHGLPALSINWGSWARIGAASSAVILERLARQGIGALEPELGATAFASALTTGEPQVVAAAVDWQEFEKLRGHTPLVEGVRAAPAAAPTSTTAFSDRLERASGDARLEMLTEYVRAEVAKATGVGDPALVRVDRGFFEQGMDSLSSIELRNRLQRGLGRSLPATLAFDYPNVEALVAFLRDHVYGPHYFEGSRPAEVSDQSPASPAVTETSSPEDMESAIAYELAQLEALLRPHR